MKKIFKYTNEERTGSKEKQPSARGKSLPVNYLPDDDAETSYDAENFPEIIYLTVAKRSNKISSR